VVHAAEQDRQELHEGLALRLSELLLTCSLPSGHGGDRPTPHTHGTGTLLCPGWSYKIYAYAPAEEEAAATAERAASVESRGSAGAASGGLGGAGPLGDAARGLVPLRLSSNLFEGGTGCHEWDAGFSLFEFVLSNPTLFRGEAGIGCGC
jgi:hypothetical protein